MPPARSSHAARTGAVPRPCAWRSRRAWAAALAAGLGTAVLLLSPATGGVTLAVNPAAVRQGETVLIRVSGAAGLVSARLEANGRTVPLYPAGDGFQTLLGTDPLTAPGPIRLVLAGVDRSGQRVSARARVTLRDGRFGVRHVALSPETMRLLSPERVAEERRRFQEAIRHPSSRQWWARRFLHPVEGALSSGYGVRSIYSGRPGGYHLGVDYGVEAGTSVRAASRGLVTLADRLPLSGNIVVIDHGLGVFTSYHHLSAIAVRAGQEVARGQVIGSVGSTGLSTGPHLHWGMLVHRARVNPVHWTDRPPLP